MGEHDDNEDSHPSELTEAELEETSGGLAAPFNPKEGVKWEGPEFDANKHELIKKTKLEYPN